MTNNRKGAKQNLYKYFLSRFHSNAFLDNVLLDIKPMGILNYIKSYRNFPFVNWAIFLLIFWWISLNSWFWSPAPTGGETAPIRLIFSDSKVFSRREKKFTKVSFSSIKWWRRGGNFSRALIGWAIRVPREMARSHWSRGIPTREPKLNAGHSWENLSVTLFDRDKKWI